MRIILLFILALTACSRPSQTETERAPIVPNSYATGFSISAYDSEIIQLDLTEMNQRIYLIPKTSVVPNELTGELIIRTPVAAMVCTSTTHIPLLTYLDSEDVLTGFPTTDYISTPSMRARVDAGLVKDLGTDQSINVEMLLELGPEMVMAYSFNGPGPTLQKIESMGIPVMYNNEYLEPHPLGRAEWIKVAGLLLDKSTEADSIFRFIETRYNQITTQVKLRSTIPSAFSGVIYGDSWFLPGGQNYAARLLADAGILYSWAGDTTSGFLELSVETVLDKAQDADLWIGVASFESRSEMADADNRYSLFRAFKEGNVYTYNRLKGETGGSVFLELGYLRPDLILSDLAQIGHPGILPNDSLYFHAKLPE